MLTLILLTKMFVAWNAMSAEVQRLLPMTLVEWGASPHYPKWEVIELHSGPRTRTIMVQFVGNCAASGPHGPAEGGEPLGWTHSGEDGIEPFIWVDCERLRSLLRTPFEAEYGKALGRVVAHEIFHVVTQRSTHSKEGLMKKALTPSLLTYPNVWWDYADFQTLQLALGARGTEGDALLPVVEKGD